MEIKIYGNNDETTKLTNVVTNCLEELGLNEFIKLEKTNDEKLKTELSITKQPALIIIEESIDFKDIIFEGMIPEEEEIKSMLVSIIGGGDQIGCAPTSCGGCPSESVCG